MYLWADVLFLVPAGMLLDRYSTRTIILSALMVCILSTVGFALTHSYYWACFFRFLSGIGNAFCFLACVVLIARWFVPNRQALIIGLTVTLAFLGGMVAHTPFAYLNTLLGWRYSLLVDALFGLLLWGWIAYIVQDYPSGKKSLLKASAPSPSLRSVIHNRQTWLGGIYTCFLNLPIMVLCALWGASYLQIVHQVNALSASSMISLIYIGSMIGCPVAGWISDHYGQRKPIMIVGALGTLLCVLPLLYNGSLSYTSLSVLFFTLGFLTSTQVVSYPLIAESNAPSNTGTATGLASLLIMGGAGVGQVVFGWLMQHHADHSSEYVSVDYQYAMWMFPITAAAALIAVLLMHETYCKRLKRAEDASNDAN